MNKFLLGIVVALVSAFLLSCLGAPRGIIEGEGFRMVRNGQTLWEMMPAEDGRVKISFSPGGREVCEMWFGEKAVSSKCTVGSTVCEVVVVDGAYSNNVSVDNGKVMMYRVAARAKLGKEQAQDDRSYDCADNIITPNGEATTEVRPNLVSKRFRAGFGEATFELSDNQASLRGRVRDDVDLNLLVGGALPDFSCLGNLVSGFVVKLANKQGKWSWTNQK